MPIDIYGAETKARKLEIIHQKMAKPWLRYRESFSINFDDRLELVEVSMATYL